MATEAMKLGQRFIITTEAMKHFHIMTVGEPGVPCGKKFRRTRTWVVAEYTGQEASAGSCPTCWSA